MFIIFLCFSDVGVLILSQLFCNLLRYLLGFN
ncbi:hypothetical protein LINPERPRIM_LOCUS22044 [Linum perenne]